MEEVARRMIEGAGRPDKIAAAPLLDLVKSAAILTDKMLMLRGQPAALALCPTCRRTSARRVG